jgi:phosphate transport system substrate-binding protein
MSPDLKELAVQGYDGGPYVHRTLETVHDRTYPLYTQQYFFVNRPAGKPVDPMVEEFVRYVLSQEGQECVESEGRYLPLTADVVQGALGKLE